LIVLASIAVLVILTVVLGNTLTAD